MIRPRGNFETCNINLCIKFLLVDGHDSAEDAIAALDLMKYQIMEDYKKLNQKKL